MHPGVTASLSSRGGPDVLPIIFFQAFDASRFVSRTRASSLVRAWRALFAFTKMTTILTYFALLASVKLWPASGRPDPNSMPFLDPFGMRVLPQLISRSPGVLSGSVHAKPSPVAL